MKRLELVAWGCIAVAATAMIGQKSGGPAKSGGGQTAPPAGSQADRGQKAWEQNCSRCHSAPQGFPASISGTVARHMRVRANLSEADVKALMKFLHPS